MYSDEGLIAELDSSGNITKSYGYRPNSIWTIDPLFMKEGNDYYFYHNDHLGTPQKLMAVNGAVAWSAKYSSFGEAEVDPTSTITNNLRFPGQYYDQETGLHYNWHRYYNPGTGRYLTPDPIVVNVGVNFYSYTGNKPTILGDCKGLKIECINKVASVNIGVWFIAAEDGSGILTCADECKGRKCYKYFFACGGGGIGINDLPIVTGTANTEVGGWSGDDIGAFGGFSLQLSGSVAVGSKGVSGSGVLSLGPGSVIAGGATAGAAVGLAAGGAVTGCWTWGLSEVPCVLPF